MQALNSGLSFSIPESPRRCTQVNRWMTRRHPITLLHSMIGTQKGRKDIFMRNSGYKNRLIDWSRFAVRLGLILTDPKVRDEINDQLKTRVDRVTDTITSKYEDASDRLTAAGAALQGKPCSRAVSRAVL